MVLVFIYYTCSSSAGEMFDKKPIVHKIIYKNLVTLRYTQKDAISYQNSFNPDPVKITQRVYPGSPGESVAG